MLNCTSHTHTQNTEKVTAIIYNGIYALLRLVGWLVGWCVYYRPCLSEMTHVKSIALASHIKPLSHGFAYTMYNNRVCKPHQIDTGAWFSTLSAWCSAWFSSHSTLPLHPPSLFLSSNLALKPNFHNIGLGMNLALHTLGLGVQFVTHCANERKTDPKTNETNSFWYCRYAFYDKSSDDIIFSSFVWIQTLISQ